MAAASHARLASSLACAGNAHYPFEQRAKLLGAAKRELGRGVTAFADANRHGMRMLLAKKSKCVLVGDIVTGEQHGRTICKPSMVKHEPLGRFLRKIPSGKFEAAMGPATMCAVAVETDDATGLAQKIGAVRLGGRLEEAKPAFWA